MLQNDRQFSDTELLVDGLQELAMAAEARASELQQELLVQLKNIRSSESDILVQQLNAHPVSPPCSCWHLHKTTVPTAE